MGIETQTVKPQAVGKMQVHTARKRTSASAAAAGGDANLSTCPAAAPVAGATDDSAFLPRKKMLVAISNDGWGDFFKSRDNFVEMHIF